MLSSFHSLLLATAGGETSLRTSDRLSITRSKPTKMVRGVQVSALTLLLVVIGQTFHSGLCNGACCNEELYFSSSDSSALRSQTKSMSQSTCDDERQVTITYYSGLECTGDIMAIRMKDKSFNSPDYCSEYWGFNQGTFEGSAEYNDGPTACKNYCDHSDGVWGGSCFWIDTTTATTPQQHVNGAACCNENLVFSPSDSSALRNQTKSMSQSTCDYELQVTITYYSGLECTGSITGTRMADKSEYTPDYCSEYWGFNRGTFAGLSIYNSGPVACENYCDRSDGVWGGSCFWIGPTTTTTTTTTLDGASEVHLLTWLFVCSVIISVTTSTSR